MAAVQVQTTCNRRPAACLCRCASVGGAAGTRVLLVSDLPASISFSQLAADMDPSGESAVPCG